MTGGSPASFFSPCQQSPLLPGSPPTWRQQRPLSDQSDPLACRCSFHSSVPTAEELPLAGEELLWLFDARKGRALAGTFHLLLTQTLCYSAPPIDHSPALLPSPIQGRHQGGGRKQLPGQEQRHTLGAEDPPPPTLQPQDLRQRSGAAAAAQAHPPQLVPHCPLPARPHHRPRQQHVGELLCRRLGPHQSW